MKTHPIIFSGISSLILASLIVMQTSYAGPVSETVYYTTYNGGGQDVWKAVMSYTGNGNMGNGTFSVGVPTNLAVTPGSDGIVMNPNNNQLLIGGQGTGNIYQVPTSGGSYTTLAAGMGTFEITVDPTGNTVYGGGSEGGSGQFTAVPINPVGSPTVLNVTGSSNSVTHITFYSGLPSGTAFYTSTSSGGTFGTINLSTGVTTAIATGVPYSHGMIFDPFTGDLIMSGGDQLTQIDPNTDAVISSITFAGNNLDQGSVDGKGHLFWADNNGDLAFIDYSNTGLIGSSANFTSDNFLAYQLDDLAPIVGEGGTGNTVPEPGTLMLLGMGIAGLLVLRIRGQS